MLRSVCVLLGFPTNEVRLIVRYFSVYAFVCVFLWSWSKTVAVGVVGNVNKCACLRPGEKATSDRVSECLFTAVQRVCVCVCGVYICVNFGRRPKEKGETA